MKGGKSENIESSSGEASLGSLALQTDGRRKGCGAGREQQQRPFPAFPPHSCPFSPDCCELCSALYKRPLSL